MRIVGRAKAGQIEVRYALIEDGPDFTEEATQVVTTITAGRRSPRRRR